MSGKTKKTSSVQKWLDASHSKYGQGEGATLPTGNTREDQDVLSVYESAAQNAMGIEKRAENAQLQANKAFDLTQKYLAAQNEANGLTGLGISDTSLLRASSQYQQALAEANATREQSLLENYKAAQEDVSTIRGEWASKEEARKEEVKNTALYSDDLDAVKKYLASNGIVEGSDDYNSIMSAWEMTYDAPTKASEEIIKEFENGKILNSGNHDNAEEWGATAKIEKSEPSFTVYSLMNSPDIKENILGNNDDFTEGIQILQFQSMAKKENEGKIFTIYEGSDKFVCIDGNFYRVTMS